jgi:hypothetical protein
MVSDTTPQFSNPHKKSEIGFQKKYYLDRDNQSNIKEE